MLIEPLKSLLDLFLLLGELRGRHPKVRVASQLVWRWLQLRSAPTASDRCAAISDEHDPSLVLTSTAIELLPEPKLRALV